MSIGSRIKELRETKGISRNEFASMLGVTVGAISNYENDVSSPKEPILFKIIETLNCDANYLFQDVVKIKSQQNDVTLSEYEHIKKYRDLDDHGKKMVDFTLQNEWERSTWQPIEGQISLIPENGYIQTWHNGKLVNWMKVEDFLPEDEPILNAAHARTDIEVTAADQQHDDDIMDDENF